MRYTLNPDKPYSPKIVPHEHHKIWEAYQPLFEERGNAGVPDFLLHSCDMAHGKGVNEGNTHYFRYCVKRGYIIPVKLFALPDRSAS